MKRSLALFAALALGACMGGGDKPKQPAPIPDSGPYVVDMDTGGGTKAYARHSQPRRQLCGHVCIPAKCLP